MIFWGLTLLHFCRQKISCSKICCWCIIFRIIVTRNQLVLHPWVSFWSLLLFLRKNDVIYVHFWSDKYWSLICKIIFVGEIGKPGEGDIITLSNKLQAIGSHSSFGSGTATTWWMAPCGGNECCMFNTPKAINIFFPLACKWKFTCTSLGNQTDCMGVSPLESQNPLLSLFLQEWTKGA